MADAVQRLWPDAKITIGPPIENGFYYDFDAPHPFSDEDLERIELFMAEIVAANHPFVERELSREEAIAYFENKNEPYKVELARGIPEGERITLHSHGDFVDLCRGGHCKTTGEIKAFKLLSVAGAYWRGDSRNKMLQRIYGTAFPDAKQLRTYLAQVEEAKKRDHRKLGKELGLFMVHPFAPGATFWLPRGAVLYQTLSDVMRKLLLGEGYVEVRTPLIFNMALFERSGHAAHYKEHMFHFESEDQTFGLKPMNCPSHMLIYGSELRSYRDLPLRLHDQGVLHRNEPSGTLGGLTRVRQFSQDDGHTYLMPSQVGEEIARLIDLVHRVYQALGLTYTAKISTRNPEKFMGDVAVWDEAEKTLEEVVKAKGLAYHIEPHEAAFYGPKIDFDITDALGRKWQCATIQLDYMAPERFDLTYVGEDNAPHRPVVIHRAIFGSFERFIALLIEHYAGAFPLWLAPIQARVVVVSEKHEEFAREAQKAIAARGLRVDMDLSNDKLGAKIRRAQLDKIPYMLVIGDKEVAARAVAPRARDGKQLDPMPLGDFADRIAREARPPLTNSMTAGDDHPKAD
ncbi:MAG: threonine--tRNA ligase [Myxococcales bacterium]|nr:threonine--tRNA ligase [Myxococcales bacterium]